MSHDPLWLPETKPSPSPELEAAEASRRGFVLMSVGMLLAGCAAEQAVTRLPGPAWETGQARRRPVPEPELEPVTPGPLPADTTAPTGVLARRQWARGRPVPSRMNRMLPVRYITVHHDAQIFYSADKKATAAQIEGIRRIHRNKRGWGDIGYHFVVDRAGRVWEARSLAYQGAHVRDHNEGNIGVVALGNFDVQRPTPAQLDALTDLVDRLMRQYHVPVSKLRTHQEWAVTACPGGHLQTYMTAVRHDGHFS